MKEKFWNFMDSAKGFCTLIFFTLFLGLAWMIGSRRMINWALKGKHEV